MARLWSRTSWQYVRLADHADLDASTAVTVMCWCYPTSLAITTGSFRHLISKWDAYLLRLFNTTLVGFAFSIRDAGAWYDVAQGSLPTIDQWYHLAGTYDGTTIKLRVYDAAAKTTNNYTTAHSGSIDSSANLLYLGQYQGDLANARFDGRLAQVRMWKDVAFSDAEIDLCRWYQGPYRSPKAVMPILGASPEPDFSGNNHSGTVSGPIVADNPPMGPGFGFDLGWQGQVPVPPSQTILDYERKFRGVGRGSWRGVA